MAIRIFAVYYKEPAKTIPNPKLNLRVYIWRREHGTDYFDSAFPNLTRQSWAR